MAQIGRQWPAAGFELQSHLFLPPLPLPVCMENEFIPCTASADEILGPGRQERSA